MDIKEHIKELDEVIDSLVFIREKLKKAEGEFTENGGLFLIELKDGILAKSCKSCPVQYFKKLKEGGNHEPS